MRSWRAISQPETPVTVGRFLDAQVSSCCSWPWPGRRPAADAGTGRVKTWNPENLETCRAPQPRRFPGFQISRFPPPARPAPTAPTPPIRGFAALARGDARGRGHGGGHAAPPSGAEATTPGTRRAGRSLAIADAGEPPSSARSSSTPNQNAYPIAATRDRSIRSAMTSSCICSMLGLAAGSATRGRLSQNSGRAARAQSGRARLSSDRPELRTQLVLISSVPCA